MKWALILHIYQPPNQRSDIFNLVAKESYQGLFDLLLETDCPITLNVSGILVTQLQERGHDDLIDKLRRLYAKPNIHFTNTAFTHPLLPLWPNNEIAHQLTRNITELRAFWGESFNPKSVYLPECAYSHQVDVVLAKLGVNWVLIDEISLVRSKYLSVAKRYGFKHHYLIRNRQLSLALATSISQFSQTLKSIETDYMSAVAALDGEVFGHFDSQSMERLGTILKMHGQAMIATSQLAAQPHLPTVRTRAGSWETEPKDLQSKLPFPLWRDPKNRINRVMWSFYQDVYNTLLNTKGLQKNQWVRHHFDNAISSCWWWWANPKRRAGPFKMEVWNPDLIVTGINEAIRAVRTDTNISQRRKWRLETKHADLLKLIWRTHWKLKS